MVRIWLQGKSFISELVVHLKHFPCKSGAFNSTFQSRIQYFSSWVLLEFFSPCILWVGSYKTTSNSLKAKSCDKATADEWSFKRKKKRKCSHDPFRSLCGWEMLSIYQQGCVEVHWNSDSLIRTCWRTFPLQRWDTELIIYLNLLLSLLRVRNDQEAPQGKSWQVQLGVLFSNSNDVQVSQDRTPSGDQEGRSQLGFVELDGSVLSAQVPWALEVRQSKAFLPHINFKQVEVSLNTNAWGFF